MVGATHVPQRGINLVFCSCLIKSRYYRLASCLVFPLLMPLILMFQLNFYQVRVIPHGTHMSHKTLAGNMQGTDIDFRNANMRYHKRWDLPKSPSCHLLSSKSSNSSTIIYYHLLSSKYHLWSSIHIHWMYRTTGQNRLGCSYPAPALQVAPFLQKPLDMAKASDFTQHGDLRFGI